MRNVLPNGMRAGWQRLDSRSRRRYAVIGALLAAIGAVSASVWLRSEHVRLSLREGEAAAQLKAMQDEIAEIDRLKGRAHAPALTGPALLEAIAASLQSRGLPLTVSAVDAERLRVSGTADFDRVMRWLAAVQHDQRLALTLLSASGQQGVVKLELTLGAAQE